MWIPETLYKSLPAVYATGGAACLLVSGWQGPALLSGAALLAAAATISIWRVSAAVERRRHYLKYAKPAPRRGRALAKAQRR
jgi:hypothetical protein